MKNLPIHLNSSNIEELHQLFVLRPLRGYKSPYSFRELRKAVRLFYYLPSQSDVVLDLKASYDRLGREWKDVFNLYASGYTLEEIASYWFSLMGSEGKERKDKKDSGNKIIVRLINRIHWLLSLGYDKLK